MERLKLVQSAKQASIVPIDEGYGPAKAVSHAQMRVCKGMEYTIPSALYPDINQAIITFIRPIIADDTIT